MQGTKAPQKTYSLRGKVTKVYEPRPVKMRYGSKTVTKEVSDLYLTLDTGAKVKISFWDTDVSHHEGAQVVISHLVFREKYNNVPQYSATKETEISVTKKGTAKAAPAAEQDEEAPEGAELEETPEFHEPEDSEPETAESEPEPEATSTKTAKRTTRKTTAAVIKEAALAYQVHPDAVAEITALAAEAVRIAEYTANGLIKSDPKAFASFTDTIFINLSTKNYYANGGRNGQ